MFVPLFRLSCCRHSQSVCILIHSNNQLYEISSTLNRLNRRMKTLAVDNPVDTPSHHRRSQSAANLSTPTRYKVCSNGFAYITTPTTSIFQQLVLASMMWFVSISLFQVVQTSYYIIASTILQANYTARNITDLLPAVDFTELAQAGLG